MTTGKQHKVTIKLTPLQYDRLAKDAENAGSLANVARRVLETNYFTPEENMREPRKPYQQRSAQETKPPQNSSAPNNVTKLPARSATPERPTPEAS